MGHGATVNGPWTWAAVDTSLQCSAGEYVKVELESTAGVDAIAVTLPTADPTRIAAGMPVVTVNQSTKTATFQLPAAATSINVAVTINNGAQNGVTQPAYTSELQAYVPTSTGLVLLAVGETDQYSRTYGHSQKLNVAIESVAGVLPSGVDGDMLCHDGTGWGTLSVGDTGKVLVSSGSSPQWAYPTGLHSAVTMQSQLVVGPDEGPTYPGQVAVTDDGGIAVAMTWSGTEDSRKGDVVQLAETWTVEGETVPGQINSLTLSGATMANTDAGRVYVTIEADGSDNMVIAYSDSARTVSAAIGLDEGRAGGAVALSGAMSGVIDIDASALPDATAIATLGPATAVRTVSGAPVGELGRPFAGVMYTNGASDGDPVWVVVAGKAKVLTYAGAAAGGYLYIDTPRAYPDAGKVDCELPRTTAYEDHGIGRALERVTSGLVLTQLDLRGYGPVLAA